MQPNNAPIVTAIDARRFAYAPYSKYRVGAALVGADGRVWSGCNVENISFAMSICAERTAIVKMVSEGCRSWTHLSLATKDGATPCGMCLQTLAEFCDDPSTATIECSGESGSKMYTLQELLPHGFSSTEVR